MVMSLPKGAVWSNFELLKCCHILILHIGQILELIFKWEPEGIQTWVLHVNCIYISELDVGF